MGEQTKRPRYQGPTPPEGALTVEEVARLPGFAGWHRNKVDRHLDAYCIGEWRPDDGPRNWRKIFDASKAREIAASLLERDQKAGRRPRERTAVEAEVPIQPATKRWRPTSFGRYATSGSLLESYPVEIIFYFCISSATVHPRDPLAYGRQTVLVESTWDGKVTNAAVERMVKEVLGLLKKRTGRSLVVRRVSLFTIGEDGVRALE